MEPTPAFVGLDVSRARLDVAAHGGAAFAVANDQVRAVLSTAALSARRHDPAWRAFADRLEAAGKAKTVVLVAVARKLLHMANAILRSGKPWDPALAPAAAKA